MLLKEPFSVKPMATSYSPPAWMSQALGLPTRANRVPFAPAYPPEEVMVEEEVLPPGYGRMMAAARLTNGNNSIANPASIARQYQIQFEDQARRANAMSMGRMAVEALKQRQWQQGLRTAMDGEAPPAGYVAPFNPNGVNNGVAYRNGRPVGFAGAVPGVAAIPEAGFRPNEQAAFQKALWKSVAAPVPPRAIVVEEPVIGAPVASVPVPAVVPSTTARMPITPAGLPDDTPEAASRAARMARGMPFGALRAGSLRAAMDASVLPKNDSGGNTEEIFPGVSLQADNSLQTKSNQELFDSTGAVRASGVVPWLAINFGSGGAQLVDLFETYLSDPLAEQITGRGSAGEKLNLQQKFLTWLRKKDIPLY